MSTRVAFVTGAGRGIGRGIALRLAKDGFAIGVTDVDGTAAAAVAHEVTATGGAATSEVADVTELGSMRSAVAAVEKTLGPLDVLVNNAGWDRLGLFVESEPEFWDRIIAINLKGVFNTTRAALDGMIARRGGRVINIASDAGRVGSSGEAVYSACKGGVIAFTKALAREVARHDITVNAVAPGATDTQLLADVMVGERGARTLEGMRRAIPFRRLGQPEDIAGLVAYFASSEASYVTGQVMSISGGLTMAG